MKKTLIFILLLFINITNVYAKDTVKFSACVDGDTIKVSLDDEIKTVRLLAVDTPESVKPNTPVEYYGKEASEYTCNKVKNAKKIELEYDSNSDKEDKYGRLLAWVFVDKELLQSNLVELGYAKVAYLYGDYKYTYILEEKQELASIKEIGIWNQEAKNDYEKTLGTNLTDATSDYSNKEIVIIVVLLLIIAFVGDKTIKNKAKKKLKKYL